MKNRKRSMAIPVMAALLLLVDHAVAQERSSSSIQELKRLSIEELMDIEVTSVTRSPQKLASVASAVQVITREEIRRSAATNIAEALRLVSNLRSLLAASFFITCTPGLKYNPAQEWHGRWKKTARFGLPCPVQYVRPIGRSSFSIATFYHRYDDVYSVEAIPGTFTYQIQNGSEAQSWGAEFSGFYQLTQHWTMRGGFTYINKDLNAKQGHQFDPSYLANDVRHQVMIQSMLDISRKIHLDVVGRYLDYIPALATARVPSYMTADVRLAWQHRAFEFSFIGQNLAKRRHREFDILEIPRGFLGKVSVRF